MDSAISLLTEHLRRLAPADGPLGVLVLGEESAELTAALDAARYALTRPAAASLDALDGLGRLPAAVCSGLLTTGREPLLARVRDLHAGAVFALEPAVTPGLEPDASLRALGFVRLGPTPARDGETCLYGHDVATYKRTPDWLNSRHWANPELWDAYRW